MILFICLFFPPVLSVWLYGRLRGRGLCRKQWLFYCTASVMLINLFCYLVKRVAYRIGAVHIIDLYTDPSLPDAGRYLLAAVPAALAMTGALHCWENRKRYLSKIRKWQAENISLIPEKQFEKKKVRLPEILCWVLLTVGSICYFAARWYAETYGQIGFAAVVYTLTANLGGVQSGLIISFLKKALIPAVGVSAVIGLALFAPWGKCLKVRIGKKWELRLFPVKKRSATMVMSIVISASMLVRAAIDVELFVFIDNIRNPSTFFQENYTAPEDAVITFPHEKRNLIYIFLESMEVSFFSEEQGGALPYNVIPELYDLAEENVNFSHNDGIGGFPGTSGTGWTSAAMVAQTAGIPLITPVGAGGNEYGSDGVFLPGVTSITNVLKENGYTQALMFGSDASFGGRKAYFQSHGMDQIFDNRTAVSDGIIPEGYHAWWGMEDKYLFEYARQVLLELDRQETPFSFTMLTADTHHVDGYICELCENTYEEQYENVYQCSSRQVAEFVSWIQQQEFFRNTTIVIVGDHTSMDGAYVSRNMDADYIRRTYNCFINSAAEADNEKNRVFTAMDLFPTTLAALGCTIEGERLGLGTNLFSKQPTIAEQLGLDEFNQETARFSSFYFEQFHQ